MGTKIFDYLSKSPATKTIIFGISTIVSGILTGIFVYEITSSGIVNWKTCYKAKSLYLILIWLVMIYIYNLLLYRKEIDILRFKDEEYCKAYIRSQCLPEIAAKYRETIKNGDTDVLKDIVVEMKRIMK